MGEHSRLTQKTFSLLKKMKDEILSINANTIKLEEMMSSIFTSLEVLKQSVICGETNLIEQQINSISNVSLVIKQKLYVINASTVNMDKQNTDILSTSIVTNVVDSVQGSERDRNYYLFDNTVNTTKIETAVDDDNDIQDINFEGLDTFPNEISVTSTGGLHNTHQDVKQSIGLSNYHGADFDISVDQKYSTKMSSSSTAHGKDSYLVNNLVKAPIIRKKKRVTKGEKEYHCTECGKCYAHRDSLNTHLRIHTGIRPFKCQYCEKTFAFRNSFIYHTLSHTGERPYTCDLCQDTFKTPNQLRVHSYRHTKVTPYQCDHCSRYFTCRVSLILHVRGHTGEKPFTCNICKKGFSNRRALKKHGKVHNFPCQFCDKEFSLEYQLKLHMRKHTDYKPFDCDECGKQFKEKGRMKSHKLTHLTDRCHACDQCEKKFTRLKLLNIHKKTHSDLRYKCPFCEKEMKKEFCFKSHIKAHMGDKEFCCDKCPSSFTNTTALKKHKKSHDPQFKCDKCERCFSHNYKLKDHYKIHTGEPRKITPSTAASYEKAQCDICKMYVSKGYMKLHKQIHNGLNLVPCEICGKKLSSKAMLKVHMNMHAGIKPYECKPCNKSFSSKTHLTRHEKNIHRTLNVEIVKLNNENEECSEADVATENMINSDINLDKTEETGVVNQIESNAEHNKKDLGSSKEIVQMSNTGRNTNSEEKKEAKAEVVRVVCKPPVRRASLPKTTIFLVKPVLKKETKHVSSEKPPLDSNKDGGSLAFGKGNAIEIKHSPTENQGKKQVLEKKIRIVTENKSSKSTDQVSRKDNTDKTKYVFRNDSSEGVKGNISMDKNQADNNIIVSENNTGIQNKAKANVVFHPSPISAQPSKIIKIFTKDVSIPKNEVKTASFAFKQLNKKSVIQISTNVPPQASMQTRNLGKSPVNAVLNIKTRRFTTENK